MSKISVHQGEPDKKGKRVTPWAWIPTINVASGLPYVAATITSGAAFKTLGYSNEKIAFFTSLLILPWTIKPLWSPLVEKYGTKRNWALWMQALLCITFVAFAIALQFPPAFAFTLAMLALLAMALASATHDIAVDGHYLLALREEQQAFFIGVRSTFWRFALLGGTGLIPLGAGLIIANTGPKPQQAEIIVTPSAAVQVSPNDIAPEGDTAEQPIADDVPDLAPETEEGAPGITHGTLQDVAETSIQGGTDSLLVFSPSKLEVAPGETGTLYVSLREPPEQGREVVATVNHVKKKPPEITLTGGERLVFTAENYNVPQPLTIKVDKTATAGQQKTFRVSAGNIPLAWTIVMLSCAGLFALFLVLHIMIYPAPVADVPAPNLPPVYKPVGIVFAVIILPFLVLYALYRLPNDIPVQEEPPVATSAAVAQAETAPAPPEKISLTKKIEYSIIGKDAAVKDQKIFAFLWSATRWIVLLGVIGLLLMIPGIRNATGRFYQSASDSSGIGFAEVFTTFFQKKNIGIMLAFLLLYRLGEAHIVAMGKLFLLDTKEAGGAGLSLTDYGTLYGVFGTAALVVGGILGGWSIAYFGLKRWLMWVLALAINVPDLVYVYMAQYQPSNLLIGTCVAVEYFGYGMGFAGYLMYMVFMAQGPYKTAHYALCTGFMALGVMIPGMWSGALYAVLDAMPEVNSYVVFFWVACILTIPGMLLIPFLPLDETFGKKEQKADGSITGTDVPDSATN